MLQEALRLMFQDQQPNLLIKSLKPRQQLKSVETPDRNVVNEPYVYRASRRGVKGSLDQLEVQLNVIRDYYFHGVKDDGELHYAEDASVLNLLLHFSKDKLVHDDGELCCRYRHIDEWHAATSRLGEDLFTTSYLAAYDLRHGLIGRKRFRWAPYLGVETSDENHLFERPHSELHAHLKGSSANFDLSWLSLMNYPCHRERDFLSLFGENSFSGNSKKSRDLRELYLCVALAVALRLYLFSVKRGLDTKDLNRWIRELVSEKSVEEMQPILCEMSSCAWHYRTEYGRKYGNLGDTEKCPDYAITDAENGLISIMTGERSLLYYAFLKAYDGDEQVSHLLYAYLIFKQQLREKIIQLNDVVGFANFDIYERRKSCFIADDSVYERLLVSMAFLNFLGTEDSRRYMEGRVVPKATVEENSESVRKMDSYVYAWLPDTDKISEENSTKEKKLKQFNGHYIYHFIKEKDVAPSAFAPRHYKLRQKVKRQAVALFDYRCTGYKSASRVVGIDAANSEIKCRPEVFAQAYRFLRRHDIREEVEYHPSALGFTYHVGEDFYDIVDGLRAVDEVLTYMNFRSNDRLGHALVLGTDVKRYYDVRDKSIKATKQVLLDNFVWLCVRVARVAGRTALCEYIEEEAKCLYRDIYTEAGFEKPFDIHNYYDSWLLRGDAPETAVHDIKAELTISAWDRSARNEEDADVNRARKNPNARDLYYEYHYNKKAKENGNKSVILPIAYNHYAEFVEMVDKVREVLLCKIERLHIAIECNPSSNLRIGEMTSYIEHPIFRFNNYGLNTPYPPHEISVSINTDDSGVFATSLEREYALMGIALEKADNPQFKNSPRAVKEWLNRVRKMSVEQRFKKE